MYLKTFGGAALQGAVLRRPKPLLLLGYLAAEGARSRQHLRELFWPTAADPAASLRMALKQIREAAPGAIKEDNDILSLLLPSDISELLAAFRSSPERIPQIYQGEFFSGLVLDRADEEAELGAWVITTREHFAGQVRSSIIHLAEQSLIQGDETRAAELVRQVRYLPSTKPLDAAELQQLYAITIKTGSELSTLLREEAAEFGTPLPEIVKQHPTRNVRADARESLPRATTSFIGRQAELKELLALIQEQEHRILTIQGVGGVGKTRLALELAQLQGSKQLAFVSLSQLLEAEQIPLAIAQTMRLNLASGIPPMALITSAIGNELFTLYLDNYEHFLPETQTITELLAACPGLRVVVTSRQRLALEAETLYPLSGLDLSDGQYSDATRLFLSRAQQANARFHPTPELWKTILEICQRLDGSPLAIELAAGWVRRMPVQQIAAELEQGLELLEAGGDTPGKQKSLRAIFEQSWSKLSPNEQRLLMALSVFRGGFTRASAAAVTGATLRPLLTLLDTAFLNVSEQGRYTQHPLLAHFVSEKAGDWPEDFAAIQEKFVQYFRHEAWTARWAYYSAEQRNHAAWGRDEYDNLEAAIDLAEKKNLLIAALELSVFQSLGWQSRGLLRQGAARIEPLLRRAEAAGLQQEAGYRWAAQVFCFLSLYSGGWSPEVTQQLEVAAELAREADDAACLAQTRSIQGVLLAVTGQLEQAKAVFVEAQEIALTGQAHYEAGVSFANMVSVCNNLGQSDEAQEQLARGLEYARIHHLPSIRGSLLLLKAEHLTGQGEFKDIQPALAEAESIFTELGAVKDLAFVYRMRGIASFFESTSLTPGLTEKIELIAADWANSSRLMAGNVVNRTMDLLVPQEGDLYLLKGDKEAAEQFFLTGLIAAQEQQIKPLIINNHLGLARTLFAQGKYQETLEHARTTLEQTQMMAVWCLAAEVAGAALSHLGKETEALRVWGKADAEREKAGAFRFPVYAEYYEPELQLIRRRLSADSITETLKEGQQLEREDILELLEKESSGIDIQ